jgi:hypothetical protein
MVFVTLFALFPIVFMRSRQPVNAGTHPPAAAVVAGLSAVLALYWSFLPFSLAGSGVKTLASFRATKGIHGSMFFTLSLPVSRIHLLVSRAVFGMIEMGLVLIIPALAVWTIFPDFRAQLAATDIFKYWVTLACCCSAFYGLSTLYSTFMDNVTQTWASLISIVFLYWLSGQVHIPGDMNIFQAIGADSPLFTHQFPLSAMLTAASIFAVLFAASAVILYKAEY